MLIIGIKEIGVTTGVNVNFGNRAKCQVFIRRTLLTVSNENFELHSIPQGRVMLFFYLGFCDGLIFLLDDRFRAIVFRRFGLLFRGART